MFTVGILKNVLEGDRSLEYLTIDHKTRCAGNSRLHASVDIRLRVLSEVRKGLHQFGGGYTDFSARYLVLNSSLLHKVERERRSSARIYSMS